MLWPSIRYGSCGQPCQRLREAGLLPYAQGMHILHQNIRRIFVAEIAMGMIFSHAFSMTQMVVPGYQNPPIRQITGDGVIPVRVFRHSMDDLERADRFSVRSPLHRMNLRPPIRGRVVKLFLFHAFFLLCLRLVSSAEKISRSQLPQAFPFPEPQGPDFRLHPPRTEACLRTEPLPAWQALSSPAPLLSFPPSPARYNAP